MDDAGVELRYSRDHLWLRQDGAHVTIGVAEKISRILTWVNEVDLPNPGSTLAEGDQLAEIESQKADISIPAPAPLEVVAVNGALETDPMLVRMDPRGQGWIVTAALEAGAWERLLEPGAYQELLRSSA
jgi:glycine cleavage system H protein